MAIAQSDFLKWRWVVEASYGAGAAAAKMAGIAVDSENIRQRFNRSEDVEIEGTQQVPRYHNTRQWTEGTIRMKMKYTDFTAWAPYALRAAAWTASVTVLSAGTASAVVSGNKYTHASAWTANPTQNQWIYVSGFVTAANNGWKKISGTVTNTEIPVSGGTLSGEAGATGITIVMPQQVTNSSTISSFVLERENSDLSSYEFTALKGLVINRMRLSINEDDVIMVEYDVMGSAETPLDATGGDGSPTAASTNAAFKTNADLDFLLEGLSAAEGTSFEIVVDNGLRFRGELGVTGPESYARGRFRVTGNYSAVYESYTLYNKYLGKTATSFATALADAAGNKVLIEVVECDVTDSDRTGGGPDTDIEIKTGYEAVKDSSELVTLRIVKLPAA